MKLLRISVKDEACVMRKEGATLSDIHKKLKIPMTTLSRWLKDIPSPHESLVNEIQASSRIAVGQAKMDRISRQLMCAMIYWCEGNKSVNDAVSFTNSDPKLIGLFLKLLRESFGVDEKKFRICMHLHDYHNESKQLEFWSKITNVPGRQFMKTFRKISDHTYHKADYPGCIRVRYYDNKLARKLMSLAIEYMNRKG